MHDYVRAIILGVIQALAEFLPISSSGHLVLAPNLIGGGASSLTFDVGLHVGTLSATVIYFWREFWDIATAAVRAIARHGAAISRWDARARLGAWIVLGTIPAVIAGALLDSFIEAHVRQPWLVGAFLLGFGLLLGLADRAASRRAGEENVGAKDALLIGAAQAIALLPGVSRAGITITAARFLGFDRVTATRFSFLLSVPAIAGAAVLTLTKAVVHHEPLDIGVLLAGAITSAVLGAIVIHFLLRYLSTHSLRPFVIYRVVLGLLVIALSLTGRI
ncbi:MAG: undecaprenyl-diphosphate phosphatase [Chloroflexi bacterium]|nr:MAG: undecaprenyl-diphosphate phosphatase [Chloroflexota bacterium]